jgi:CBS-domain-containing membrane protein
MKALPIRAARTRTVRDIMKPHVVTVVPQMTVRELVQTFVDEHVRGAPVVGPSGKVVGMVSEADVLRQMLPARGESNGRTAAAHVPSAAEWNPDRVHVREIMGPVGRAFGPGDEVGSLLRFFASDGVQRAVVIENDILLGIVTPADIVRALDPSH